MATPLLGNAPKYNQRLAFGRQSSQAGIMTLQNPQQIVIALPDWMPEELPPVGTCYEALNDRMDLALTLAERNMREQTGGPFAAALFDRESGEFIAAGVNRVVPAACSSAHAEIVAISLAQQTLGSYDLGGPDMPAMQLVVNWRPCAMCFGALPWAGIRSLVICGSDDTVERVTGFDEGPIHPQWREQLKQRGIEVVDNVLYERACRLFEAFAESGAPVYNGRNRQQ
jgi:tRNA(Arg) A34 adenosine deaminase TadA